MNKQLSQKELKMYARELDESPAFNYVMDYLIQGVIEEFRGTPEDKLVDLKHRLNALDSLRSKVKDSLVNILETVDE